MEEHLITQHHCLLFPWSCLIQCTNICSAHLTERYSVFCFILAIQCGFTFSFLQTIYPQLNRQNYWLPHGLCYRATVRQKKTDRNLHCVEEADLSNRLCAIIDNWARLKSMAAKREMAIDNYFILPKNIPFSLNPQLQLMAQLYSKIIGYITLNPYIFCTLLPIPS